VTRPQTTGEIESLRARSYDVLRRDPDARDAHLRLYEVEQMLGRPAAAIEHLRAALRTSRVVTLPARRQPAEIAVLALSRVAPWEANTPLELIVDDERTTLHRYYLDDDDVRLPEEPAPPYDVLFNTIAESERARHALELAARFAERSAVRPINSPAAVARLGRSDVARIFAASTTILVPPIERADAAALRVRPPAMPFVIRPVGSQAGFALARIDAPPELQTYLDEHPHDAYFVMPFVDYRSADGFYRKYRVMFVDGAPYACHLAISPRWMIHYYNAAMAEHAWMRDEEARFLADLGGVLGGTPAKALREIAAAIPLEYFGVDCAIAPDGRLLLFEADAAMLVHGTDPTDLYPYKPAAYRRIKAALTALLRRRSRIP
jgi:hypothetical protein